MKRFVGIALTAWWFTVSGEFIGPYDTKLGCQITRSFQIAMTPHAWTNPIFGPCFDGGPYPDSMRTPTPNPREKN